MNFFSQQDKARKNTRYLVFLFLLAVFALVVLTNLLLLLLPWEFSSNSVSNYGGNDNLRCLNDEACSFFDNLNWGVVALVSVLVVGVIGCVSLFKWFSVKRGGKYIAEMMGGRLVSASTNNFQEKRLLNVVEEMAIAANMVVPAVYVMDEELSINAFAAGLTTKDAVVAVTKGTLDALDRDQLQGVIAHEFSHILNGDMRLNMKLIAILHGIMFLTEIGYLFVRSTSSRRRHSRDSSGPALALGLGLIVIGYMGTFFGSLIKSAVSRQREFLADASAVQFTRNPGGIADALKLIGGSSHGSLINDGHGTEISHLFFGDAMGRVQSLFSTHPPLKDRIKRIQPTWNGRFIQPKPAEPVQQAVETEEISTAESGFADLSPEQKLTGLAAIITAAAGDETIEVKPQDDFHLPMNAAAAICCLLLAMDENIKAKQIRVLEKFWPELSEAIKSSRWLNSPREDFLTIVEMSVSALRELSEEDYLKLKKILIQLINADGHLDLYEWALYQMLISSLDPHFGMASLPKPRYKNIADLQQEMIIVISMMVNESEQSDDFKHKAFSRACNSCGFYNAHERLDVTIADFSAAVEKLAEAYPLVKPRIIKALVDAAKMDGQIEPIEKQMIVVLAAIMDTPIPGFQMGELGIA